MDDAIKKAKELLEVVGPLDLAEFEFTEGETTIRFSRDGGMVPAAPAPAAAPVVATPAAHAGNGKAAPATAAARPAAKGSTLEITSPMVGTYYSAPSPEKPPYVNQGDMVEKDQVVCIIEAMKLMNEIKSPAKGRIAEVLVQNAEAVAKDQVVFRLEPA